jgi:hypothetical protein
METITLLDYNRYNETMYSYSMHEKQWLTRYKLRMDGKFQDEEIYEWKEPLTTEQIHYFIDVFYPW